MVTLMIMFTMFSGSNVKDSVQIWSMTINRIEGEVVYCTDENGDEWSFYGAGYKDGSQVLVVIREGEIINAY
jgi:hypothetical protein